LLSMAEAFSFLDPLKTIPGIRVDFVERVRGVDVDGERDEVLARLKESHDARVRQLGGHGGCWKAEQVHGCGIGVVGGEGGEHQGAATIAGVDGLVTRERGVTLGIYVADCGPIWIADSRNGAIGLLHSGKKGTELGILKQGVGEMSRVFGSRPSDLVVVLGPCIRPPHYETDFAAEIARQASALGVGEYHDEGIDTASQLSRYYSYRMEKGRTGRMLALIRRGEEA
ncbi:MAG: polyphenol oxidase family protein, partial [Verrucomicrobiales bacterium]